MQNPAARYVLCLALGVGVGIVVGLLGVGGNELMIPPLVVLFGLPIKEAGSVSLLISLPVVAVGMWRFHALSAFKHRDRDVMRTIVPLGLGSVVGALAGGLLAPIAPNSVLKFLLCAMLLFSPPGAPGPTTKAADAAVALVSPAGIEPATPLD